MNANELADELKKVIDVRHYASEVLRKEVIIMLRQQQADLKDADKYALELERLYEDAKAEIGCYKIELELHKAMIQDLENALKNAQTNPLQNKLDVIANRIVFGKAQEK